MRIQDAINAASPGDTIIVSSRIYSENLVIGKPINLTGVSAQTTIIDGSGAGAGITIANTSSVTVSGFTVRNTGFFDSGIVIYSSTKVAVTGNILSASNESNATYVYNSNTTTVKDNVLTGSLNGISVQGGFGNLIQENNATGNLQDGVRINFSPGNKIIENTLRKSVAGLELTASSGNIIARNLVANNTYLGISVVNSTSNLVIENRVEFNSGPNFLAGIRLQNSPGNRFSHNNILNNTVCCPTVNEQIFATNAADIASNNWDNATASALRADPRIGFVDGNSNGIWNFNETVVYDTDNNGIYDLGDRVIAAAKGTTLPTGTFLATDPKIKFIDTNGDGVWNTGEQVVYDNNDNNIFDAGEPAIAGVGGNHWSDYPGLDNGAHGFTGDGIGDTSIPHPCPGGGGPCSLSGSPGVDWYPLMATWRLTGFNVTASGSPLGGVVPVQVSFTASATGGLSPYQFLWSFGDGVISSLQNATHTYMTAGHYLAAVTVTDSSSATGSTNVAITAQAPVGALQIRVIDGGGNPISAANVTSISQPSGQDRITEIANAQGIAAWSNLTPGTYLIEVSSSGYATTRTNVVIVQGQTTNDQVILAKNVAPNNYLLIVVVAASAAAAATVVLALFWTRRRTRRRLEQTGSGTSPSPFPQKKGRRLIAPAAFSRIEESKALILIGRVGCP